MALRQAQDECTQTATNRLENKELVRRVTEECWNQGRLNLVEELFAEQVRIHDAAFPNLTRGAETMRRYIETVRGAFPDVRFTVVDSIAENGSVAIQWTASGTHEGEFLGMAPTGRRATIAGTTIYRIEGGRIAEEWVHWNLMSMMEQLGTAPGMAVAPGLPMATPAARRQPRGHRQAQQRAHA